jgi:Raf kinase inhibitor-like YbhB/YbcL family protein
VPAVCHPTGFRRVVIWAAALVLTAVPACGDGRGSTPTRTAAGPAATSPAGTQPMMAFTLKSPAFAPGQPIPRQYTGDAQDASPPLAWTGIPQGAKSLALICDDPDAPRPVPWVHWVIFNLPVSAMGLPENLPRRRQLDEPDGALQGRNSWSAEDIGYKGPAPPPNELHHYHFILYALDVRPDLLPGADKAALIVAMKGHVLGTAELIGTYRR